MRLAQSENAVITFDLLLPLANGNFLETKSC
jgi:hypothetical protein